MADTENMQEPPKQPPRQIDLIFENGHLGEDRHVAERRYFVAKRWFDDWFHSKFNPDFYAVSGMSSADDEKLSADDRYLRVYWEIPSNCQYVAHCVIILDMSIDSFIRRHPIFNGTSEEKASIIHALRMACDGISAGYEKIKAL